MEFPPDRSTVGVDLPVNFTLIIPSGVSYLDGITRGVYFQY